MKGQRYGIYGASQSGKSTKAQSLVKGCRRLVVFDPSLDWLARGGRVKQVQGIRALRNALREGWARGFRLVYIPEAGREIAELDAVARLIVQAQTPYMEGREGRKLTLVVDEMADAFPHALPRDLSGFDILCRRGSHLGVDMLGITQRIADVNTKWRGNLTGFYVFRQGTGRDVKTCQGEMFEGKDLVPALCDHEYLYVRNGRVTRGTTTKTRKR